MTDKKPEEKELNETEKQAKSQAEQHLGASVVLPGQGLNPEPTEATWKSPGEPDGPGEKTSDVDESDADDKADDAKDKSNDESDSKAKPKPAPKKADE